MQMKLPLPTYSQFRTSHLKKLIVQSTVQPSPAKKLWMIQQHPNKKIQIENKKNQNRLSTLKITENQNRNCPRSGHYKLQKQREVYDSPKHYTPPTDKEIRKYQNENIVNQTSIIKTRPEK